MGNEETYKLNMPRYLRAKAVLGNEITEVSVEVIEQVARIVDGYPSPSAWERVMNS